VLGNGVNAEVQVLGDLTVVMPDGGLAENIDLTGR